MSNLSDEVILWLPSHLAEDPKEIETVSKANGLIVDFCDRDISLEQVLDELSALNVSPDQFRETLDFSLRLRGG